MQQTQQTNQVEEILNDFSLQYATLKREYDLARQRLEQLEKNIIDFCGHKEDGQAKFETDVTKIVTTGKINRAITGDIDDLKTKIPAPLFNRLFTYKPTLSVKEYKFIENNEKLPLCAQTYDEEGDDFGIAACNGKIYIQSIQYIYIVCSLSIIPSHSKSINFPFITI